MLWPPPPPPPPMARAMRGDGDLVLLEEELAERRPLSAKLRMCPTGEAGQTSEYVRAEDVDASAEEDTGLLAYAGLRGRRAINNYSQKVIEGGVHPPSYHKAARLSLSTHYPHSQGTCLPHCRQTH